MSKFSLTAGLEFDLDPQNTLTLEKLLKMTEALKDDAPMHLDYLRVSEIELRCLNRIGEIFWIEIQSRNMSKSIYNIASFRRKIVPGHEQLIVSLKPSKFHDRMYRAPIINWDHDSTGIHLFTSDI